MGIQDWQEGRQVRLVEEQHGAETQLQGEGRSSFR